MARMKWLLCYLIISSFLFLSCSGSKEVSNYQGKWKYIFSGQASGNAEFLVNQDGSFNFEVALLENNTIIYLLARGEINNSGEIKGFFKADDQLIGSLSGTMKDSVAIGEWKNRLGMTGSWKVFK